MTIQDAIHRPWTPGAGLPVALPFGFGRSAPSTQVSALPASSRGTNTPLASAAETIGPPGIRVGHRALQRIATQAGERDMLVLRHVAEHRYLTTLQLQNFVFTSHATADSAARTCRRVLARLKGWSLIRPLQRRVGGVRAGSSATTWQLTPAGARLLRDDGTTYRTHEPSPRFLAHCLAIADVHLVVRSLAVRRDIHAVGVQIEPACWRPYTGPGGERRWLQPDLSASVQTQAYDDRWFIEVDLGTESLPTLLRKCGQYEAYRASGEEQETHGSFPLVLWVFSRTERADKLRSAIARSHRLTPDLYRFAAPEAVGQLLLGDAS